MSVPVIINGTLNVPSHHCGNALRYVTEIGAYKRRHSILPVYEYRAGSSIRYYGVQNINFKNLTATALFEYLDVLEFHLSREDERWRTSDQVQRSPVISWIYLHLMGLPTPEILQHFAQICSTKDNIFESKYSRLAITMTILCGAQPYWVTVRSTVNGWEEGIKLNPPISLDNSDLVKFQRNIVYIKQRHEITSYFKDIIGRADAAGLTEEQGFQLLSKKILAYDKDSDATNNSNTWEAYLRNDEKGLFDFSKFQIYYDQWIEENFPGNTVYVIGTDTTKTGYKNGVTFMNKHAQKHLDWITAKVEIEDPVVQQFCMKKPRKYLPPMYLFLDNRKRRKEATIEDMFMFNEAGASVLSDNQWLISSYEVCMVTFDLNDGLPVMMFDSTNSSMFRVNSRTNRMFGLYMDLRMLLECCTMVTDYVSYIGTLYGSLNASIWRNYIFGELTVKYQLVALGEQFGAHGFDVSTWTDTISRRIDISSVNADLEKMQRVVSTFLVVDGEVTVKYGKQRRRKHMKYSIGGLRCDMQTCLTIPRVEGPIRGFGLAKYNAAVLKDRGVKGPYPSYITLEEVVLGKLIYVLLPDGTLRFCIEAQDPASLVSKRLTHSQLASLGPVLDAGEMFLRKEGGKWIVFKINNSSGHYQPSPSDGLQGVWYLLRNMLKDNPFFGIQPRCSLVNALSTTRLSVVDISDTGGVVVDETTQKLGSNI